MTLVKTPYGFSTDALEIVAGLDMRGKRAIITGGAAGIGVETARALASAGADVTLAVRRPEAAEDIAATLRRETGNTSIAVRALDVSDLESVQKFVSGYDGPLHILINNAGIMATPDLQKTAQGFELQFGTNFLGHFALTVGLHANLAAANGARVVNVSSSGHLFSPVNFDDIHFDFIPYTPFGAYGQSKSALILMSVELGRRWTADGILSNALNPGAIATGLQKHTGGLKTPVERRKTPQQGAATSVLLAASPFLDTVGGRYFEDCNESPPVRQRPSDFSGGVAPYALSAANADRLWTLAMTLIGK